MFFLFTSHYIALWSEILVYEILWNLIRLPLWLCTWSFSVPLRVGFIGKAGFSEE